MSKKAKSQGPETFTISTSMIWGLGIGTLHLKMTMIRLLSKRCPHATLQQREKFVESCIANGAIQQKGSINGEPLYEVAAEYEAKLNRQ